MEELEGLTQEQLEDAVRTINAVAEVIKRLADVFTDLWNKLLYTASGKKIVHLALHGRTKRIRKKNQNRLIKSFMQLLED